MKSCYRGLYVQKDSGGKIHTVQVVDSVGNLMPIDPEIYIEKNIKPDINLIPTEEEFKISKK